MRKLLVRSTALGLGLSLSFGLIGCSGSSSPRSSASRSAPTTAAAREVRCAADLSPSTSTTTAPTPATPVDRSAVVDGHQIHVREWPGSGPTIVLMHGFPDNLHLYDALVPELQGRHVVAFDFLGWGESDKPDPTTYTYDADQQINEVDAVISQLHLAPVILVVHDSSGPPGIDWAVAHPAMVAKLVLLNTYYNPMPTIRPPEAIAIFSSAKLDKLQALIAADIPAGQQLYEWQVGGFFENKAMRAKYLPVLWSEFLPALPAFRALNQHLIADVTMRIKRLDSLRAFTRPVAVVFGEDDPYLNASMAKEFHKLFPNSSLDLVAKSNHYVQFDQPTKVAADITNGC
jgi:haloalkane dehalogenase